MSILLAGSWSDDERAPWLAALQAELPAEHFVLERGTDADAGIDIAIVANPPPAALAGLPRLRLVQSLWAGVERLLADASVPADVPIARLVDPALATAMAETALWAVLALQRGHFRYARLQREQRWAPHAQRRADALEVAVLGLGAMGRAVALRLVGNGYRVHGFSARPASLPAVACHSGMAALPALLAMADIVINLLPLTPATRGLFDAARLAQMKPGASLVNLARGGHVVEADLLAALDGGRLGHAVLDVFAVEPLPVGHALWSHPHVTVLPHVAALSDPASAVPLVAANVRALRQGRPPAHLVDRERAY